MCGCVYGAFLCLFGHGTSSRSSSTPSHSGLPMLSIVRPSRLGGARLSRRCASSTTMTTPLRGLSRGCERIGARTRCYARSPSDLGAMRCQTRGTCFSTATPSRPNSFGRRKCPPSEARASHIPVCAPSVHRALRVAHGALEARSRLYCPARQRCRLDNPCILSPNAWTKAIKIRKP